MVSFRSTGSAGGQVASEDTWPKSLDSGNCRGLTIGSRRRSSAPSTMNCSLLIASSGSWADYLDELREAARAK